MRFYLFSLIGLALFFFAFACFEYSIYHFLQIGTCSSTGYNRYGPTQVCPAGTGWYFAGVFGGVILGLIAIGLYAARGKPPDAGDDYSGPRVPFGILAWSLLFAGTAVVAIYGILGPDAHPGPGAKLGGLIVAGVFLPMGIVPLLFALKSGGSSWRSRATSMPLSAPSTAPMATPRPSPPPMPSVPPRPAPKKGGGLEQLEKLKKLRDEGALSEAEFAAAKAKILGDL
jgi:Short C-terminal domain